ncbi:MAG: iron transporter [Castellaniella sp.]|uniref:iron transporter n=1 Tax=Castellaniella sp. TaxID=1955812 RepID=UPI003C722F15
MVNKLFIALAGLGLASSALAAEYPIGEPKDIHGLEVAAVYLQPVEMEPAGMMRAAKDSDVHLEADIHATADNKNGLPEGAWAPYLNIQYVLQKQGSDKVLKGDLMPMVANDGPHYGDNVKLEGPGKYQLTFIIGSPETAHNNHFGRHVDKETGVAPWFETFEVKYDFVFAGTGKKGGY